MIWALVAIGVMFFFVVLLVCYGKSAAWGDREQDRHAAERKFRR